MDQIRRLLANLSLKQKLSIAAVAVAVVAGIFAMSRWSRERDFKPLYTNLAAEDAGQVLTSYSRSG